LKQKQVLFCVLNWGVGHATRSVVIIHKLIEANFKVYLASDGEALKVLRTDFPTLQYFELPGYNIFYPRKENMLFTMLKQLPKIRKVIRQENKIISNICSKIHFDYIISDHRYGCYSTKVNSIFITHQLQPLIPERIKLFQKTSNLLHRKMLSHFKEFWIPDTEDVNNLSRILSDDRSFPRKFIGHLSGLSVQVKPVKRFAYVALLSGPEPQRTELEKILSVQMKKSASKTLLIKGLISEGNEIETNGNYSEVGFLSGTVLSRILLGADLIFARSGYSTIMDIAKIGKQVVFIPTPGQTEQIYLAKRMFEQGWAYSMQQHEFDVEEAIIKSENYNGFKSFKFDETLLDQAIRSL
jgi:uncharacterized protein (TIGR00661 family)